MALVIDVLVWLLSLILGVAQGLVGLKQVLGGFDKPSGGKPAGAKELYESKQV